MVAITSQAKQDQIYYMYKYCHCTIQIHVHVLYTIKYVIHVQ